MERHAFGSMGHSVSAIGLGCMGMSEFYGPRDDAQPREALQAALGRGIDFFDTADTCGFGHDEELPGRFLRGQRDRMTLAAEFDIVREPGLCERRVDSSPAAIFSGPARLR